METEQKLARAIFGHEPLTELLRQSDDAFRSTDPKQFAMFYSKLLKRLEERLSNQFGACMALLEEKCGLTQREVAKEFVCSPEYRLVREDLTDLNQSSPARFEMAFLNFILRTQSHREFFLAEFCDIYLRELAIS